MGGMDPHAILVLGTPDVIPLETGLVEPLGVINH